MLLQFHIAATYPACKDLLDEELTDIIVRANFMQDGYSTIGDYFPKIYRVIGTIYKQFFRHEYHYTRFLWQSHKDAVASAEGYIKYTWEKSIDKAIPLSIRAKYLGKNLHVRQDKFTHEAGGKVTSFSPLDFLGIGYCHSKYAIDKPDKELLNKILLDTREVIEVWASHYT